MIFGFWDNIIEEVHLIVDGEFSILYGIHRLEHPDLPINTQETLPDRLSIQTGVAIIHPVLHFTGVASGAEKTHKTKSGRRVI
jgi:hypothetical protein